MELILLLITSVLVARILERSKYHVAVVAHAVLFVFMFLVYFFASDWKPFVDLGKQWLGERLYIDLHDALIAGFDSVHYGISAFLIIEIVIMLSAASLAVVAMVRGYKKIVKYIRVRASLGLVEPSLVPSCGECASTYSANPTGNIYLTLGQLRI